MGPSKENTLLRDYRVGALLGADPMSFVQSRQQKGYSKIMARINKNDTKTVAMLFVDELNSILEDAGDADIINVCRSELFSILKSDLDQVNWDELDLDAVIAHPTVKQMMLEHLRGLVTDYTGK